MLSIQFGFSNHYPSIGLLPIWLLPYKTVCWKEKQIMRNSKRSTSSKQVEKRKEFAERREMLMTKSKRRTGGLVDPNRNVAQSMRHMKTIGKQIVFPSLSESDVKTVQNIGVPSNYSKPLSCIHLHKLSVINPIYISLKPCKNW